jgi:hypothetical protein
VKIYGSFAGPTPIWTSNLVKKLIRLYDVNRERMLIAELLTSQQHGTFRELRTRLLKIFQGLADYEWKFNEKQRVVLTSVLMKTELWRKVAGHRPNSVDEILQVICELGLEPDTSHATSHAMMTHGPRVAPAVSPGRDRGLCFKFRDTGTCRFGEKCRFAHVRDGKVITEAPLETERSEEPTGYSQFRRQQSDGSVQRVPEVAGVSEMAGAVKQSRRLRHP